VARGRIEPPIQGFSAVLSPDDKSKVLS